MSDPPTPRRPRLAPLAAGALALAGLVVVVVWWPRGAAPEATPDPALAAWVDAPLPEPDTPVDSALSMAGADLFAAHCAACHAVTGEPRLGPNLAGVTRRRTARWIDAMILRPDSMTRNDPVASKLKATYGVQMMVVGDVSPLQARAILEFLRRVDAENGS